MSIEEMKNDKYNVFIPTVEGYHMEIMNASGQSDHHPLIGFVVFNPAGMPDREFGVHPVVEWRGNPDNIAIFKDEIIF